MDSAIGAKCITLAKALAWLRGSAQRIVTVGAHDMLEELVEAKKRGECEGICFVYLHKPKDLLADHLALPRAEGNPHTEATQQEVITRYDWFHRIFTELADHTICCTKDSAAIAAEVRALERDLA